MRASTLMMPTLREVPAEAEAVSHRLMMKAGLMRKLASGSYAFLPLGQKVLKKIEGIIREELDKTGAQELLMPVLLPLEPFKATGRQEAFGEEMFRLKDRNGREFCLGPAHEEIFATVAAGDIRSYKVLPKTLYQIQSKYRDEARTRFGAVRSREFIMMDACSFDRDEEGLDISYRKMYEACCRIFERCGLDYIAVEADAGESGGYESRAFMVQTGIGETGIAVCDACGYAASADKAECVPVVPVAGSSGEDTGAYSEVFTPDARTIEDLTGFLKCSAGELAKTLIYMADGRVVAAMVRGDRELNEAKLKKHLKCTELKMADAETVKRVTGADVGFAGPIGLEDGIPLIIDNEVALMDKMTVGASKTEYHYVNVRAGRDFKPTAAADIRKVAEGDVCPNCKEKLRLAKGIETGQISKLGIGYSSALGCTYLDAAGKELPMVMGCYGIGVSRTMAAVIEQHNDENGIIWPMEIAPYHVVIVIVNSADAPQVEAAERLYADLSSKGIEVLLDDRDERAGVKFKDADLIGIPLRITVGKRAGEGIVEFKERQSQSKEDLTLDEAIFRVIMKIFPG